MNTREEWLTAAIEILVPRMREQSGLDFPVVIHVSTGFPSSKGTAIHNRTIGETWHGKASSDGNPHIFIHPDLNGFRALETLVHELIHAALPKARHGAEFRRAMLAVGLTGKATATVAGPELAEYLRAVETIHLGPYPHATLNSKESPRKVQTTRMLKAVCPVCERVIRMARKTAEMGPIVCGSCVAVFEIQEKEGE